MQWPGAPLDVTLGAVVPSCAVRDDDTLWCWGDNSYGALGNDRAWAQTPVPVLVP